MATLCHLIWATHREFDTSRGAKLMSAQVGERLSGNPERNRSGRENRCTGHHGSRRMAPPSAIFTDTGCNTDFETGKSPPHSTWGLTNSRLRTDRTVRCKILQISGGEALVPSCVGARAAQAHPSCVGARVVQAHPSCAGAKAAQA